MVQHYNPSNPPKDEDLLRIADLVPNARSEDISKALPSICAALAYRDERVKLAGAFVLTIVAHRPDSAGLLTSCINGIGNLLTLPNARLQNAAVGIFGDQRPEPPPEVAPLLLAFLKRTDGDSMSQASALSVLLRIAPEKVEVGTAADNFFARGLDRDTKEFALNGVANSRTKNTHVIDIVIAALSDPDQGIRFIAAEAFARLGRGATLRAEPALQKLISNPDESDQVKTAAKKALQTIGPSR